MPEQPVVRLPCLDATERPPTSFLLHPLDGWSDSYPFNVGSLWLPTCARVCLFPSHEISCSTVLHILVVRWCVCAPWAPGESPRAAEGSRRRPVWSDPVRWTARSPVPVRETGRRRGSNNDRESAQAVDLQRSLEHDTPFPLVGKGVGNPNTGHSQPGLSLKKHL